MKTPEQILDEVAAENMINVQQMVTTKQLAITAIRRYARIYHQSKVKNLGISGVIASNLFDMKTGYTVIDHKKNMKFTYAKWQWELAFTLIFIAGIGTGVLLHYWL